MSSPWGCGSLPGGACGCTACLWEATPLCWELGTIYLCGPVQLGSIWSLLEPNGHRLGSA